MEINTPQRFDKLWILVDASTGIILYVTWDTSNYFVPEVSDDLQRIFYANLFPISLTQERCLTFQYKENTIRQNPNALAALSSTEQERLHLLHAKCTVLTHVNTNVSFIRRKYDKPVILQEQIYQEKFRQATLLRKNRYDTSTGDFSFVTQYAEIENISIKEAADIIIFKHEEQNRILAKTENVRLYCNKQILQTKTKQEVFDTWEHLKTKFFLPGIYNSTINRFVI